MKDRKRLLDLFRQSRTGREENEREKSDCDTLEEKLCLGKASLDEFERILLLEVIARNPEVSDREFHRYKANFIG